MSKFSVCSLKFVGGPLDGHQQVLSIAVDELNDVVILPVGSVLALLYKDRAYRDLNSMAVYKLAWSSLGGTRYQYVGSVSTCSC